MSRAVEIFWARVETADCPPFLKTLCCFMSLTVSNQDIAVLTYRLFHSVRPADSLHRRRRCCLIPNPEPAFHSHYLSRSWGLKQDLHRY